MDFLYPARIEQDEQGNQVVTFRDIPFAVTDGKTIEDALMEARDCLETAMASCIKDREEIPIPSDPQPGEHLIRLPAQTAAKTALYMAVRASGISQNALAEKIGVDGKEVRRMLNPWQQTKLPRIEQALDVLGYSLFVSVEAA